MFRAAVVLLASVFALTAADVSGKWTGTFAPEGGDEGPALIILEQKGDTITGTAGPDENQRREISNAKLIGDKLTFDIGREDGSMKFVLTLKGEELSGQASREREGQRQTAAVKVTRTK